MITNKAINWLLLLITLVLGVNIIRTWQILGSRGEIIKEAEDKLESEKEKREDLKRQMVRAESSFFIEKEARNRLNLGKEGEVVVILPSISPNISPSPTPIDASPNWQEWMKIFL